VRDPCLNLQCPENQMCLPSFDLASARCVCKGPCPETAGKRKKNTEFCILCISGTHEINIELSDDFSATSTGLTFLVKNAAYLS
jgi:hypothetical protein